MVLCRSIQHYWLGREHSVSSPCHIIAGSGGGCDKHGYINLLDYTRQVTASGMGESHPTSCYGDDGATPGHGLRSLLVARHRRRVAPR